MSKGTKAKNEKETERDKERGKVMNGKGERQKEVQIDKLIGPSRSSESKLGWQSPCR